MSAKGRFLWRKEGKKARARREAVPWEGIGSMTLLLLGICGFNCYAEGPSEQSRNGDFQGQVC